MSFSSDIAKFAKDANQTIEDTMSAFIIDTFSGIILDTRVDEGRLRGNWQTSTGTPKLNELDRIDKTPQGVSGGIAEKEVVETVDPNEINYLTNNLVYAKPREDKDGMIAKNIQRVNRNLQKALKEAKDKRFKRFSRYMTFK